MILDLHGIKHEMVTEIVENFIFNNQAPFYIITGNSNKMKKIVFDILDRNNFKYFINTNNLGQIIITE